MKFSRWIVALLFSAVPFVSSAADGCASVPKPVASCWVVHGRLSVYNGAWSTVIWPVGTKHLLAVAGPDVNPFMPAELAAQLVTDGSENFIYGNFDVCPLSHRHQGQIQYVCVQSAENLVVQKRLTSKVKL
jgi:hypothetical protein